MRSCTLSQWRDLRIWSGSEVISAVVSIHCSLHIDQMLPAFWSMLNYAQHFVVNRIEVRVVWQPQIWRDECRVMRSRKLAVSVLCVLVQCPAES